MEWSCVVLLCCCVIVLLCDLACPGVSPCRVAYPCAPVYLSTSPCVSPCLPVSPRVSLALHGPPQPCDLDQAAELLVILNQDPKLDVLKVFGVVFAPAARRLHHLGPAFAAFADVMLTVSVLGRFRNVKMSKVYCMLPQVCRAPPTSPHILCRRENSSESVESDKDPGIWK